MAADEPQSGNFSLHPQTSAPWIRHDLDGAWSVKLVASTPNRDVSGQAVRFYRRSLSGAMLLATVHTDAEGVARLAPSDLSLDDGLIDENFVWAALEAEDDVQTEPVQIRLETAQAPSEYVPEIPYAGGQPLATTDRGQPPDTPIGSHEDPVLVPMTPPDKPTIYGHDDFPFGYLAAQGTCPHPSVVDDLDTTTDECSFSYGDPAFMHNGEFVRSECDLYIEGVGVALQFVRTYRSRMRVQSRLGHRWDFSWNKWLKRSSTGIVFHNGFGRADLFTRDPQQPNGYQAPLGYFAKLSEQQTGFEILWANDATYRFDRQGWLVEMADRFGNRQQFERDKAGALIRVIDTRGNAVDLRYDTATGLLAAIVDWTGRSIAFSYCGTGDADGLPGTLKAVTASAGAASAATDLATSYVYDRNNVQAARRYDLVSITEAGTDRASLRNRYDAAGRLVEQTVNDGTFSFSYISKSETIVRDRAGAELKFTYFGACRRSVERTLSNGTTLRQSFVQDDLPSGYAETTRLTFPGANALRLVYDRNSIDARLRGRVLEMREEAPPQSGQPDRITRITHDSSRALVTSVTAPIGFATGGNPAFAKTTYEYDAKGQLTRVIAPPALLRDRMDNVVGQLQMTSSYSYNDRGQVVASTDAYGVTTRFVYADTGPNRFLLTSCIYDISGEEATSHFDYDVLGRPTRAVSPAGAETTVEYDSFNRKTELTGDPGTHIRYVYNARGLQAATYTRHRQPDNRGDRLAGSGAPLIDASQPWSITLYEHDDWGRLIATRDELSVGEFATVRYVYDANDQLVEQFGAEGEHIVRKYGERGLLTELIVVPGTAAESRHQYTYDGNGNETAYTDPEGRVIACTYDGYDEKTTVRTPLGSTITWERDVQGHITFVAHRDATGRLTAAREIAYNELGFPHHDDRLELDPAGVPTGRRLRTSRLIDARTGQVTEVARGILAPGEPTETVRFTYDRLGRMHSRTDDLGNRTTYAYDKYGRLARVEEHDAPSAATAAANDRRVIEYEYNTRGWMTRDRALSGDGSLVSEVAYDYDSCGRIVFTQDATGQTATAHYDAVGRLVLAEQHLRPNGNPLTPVARRVRTRYAYDRSSRIKAMTDGNGHTTRLRYDTLGRVVSTQDALGHIARYDYDRACQLTRTADPSGTETLFSYDENGRLAQKRVTLGTGVSGVRQIDLEWDDLDRITRLRNDNSDLRFEHNSLSYLVRTTQNGTSVERDVNGLGWRLRVTSPTGIVNYDKDALGRNVAIHAGTGLGGTIATYEYRGRDRVRRRGYGNGAHESFDYDGLGRLTAITNTVGANVPFAATRFALDANGMRRDIDYQGFGGRQGTYAEKISYDSIARIVGISRSGPALPPGLAAAMSFELDDADNRTSTKAGSRATNYQSNANNQYTKVGIIPQSYDVRGDLKSSDGRRFVYDYRHRLVEAQTSQGHVYFLYDELDRRIERQYTPAGGGPTEVTRYLYEGFRCIEEQDAQGATLARYIHGNGIDEVVMMERGARRYFYHHQHLGSVSHVTDDAGQVVEQYTYDLYGLPTIYDGAGNQRATSAIGNSILFTGRWYDLVLRLYDYRSRFYDPVTGQFTTPDQAGYADGPNVYAYCKANPANFLDPFGERAESDSFLEGLKDGFLATFAGGWGKTIKALWDFIKNAGEYWEKIKDIASKLSDPETRARIWDQLKAALRSALDDEWAVIEGILEAIKNGAKKLIGAALGKLLGYLLNKAVSGGIAGKIASIFGTISAKITGFLKSLAIAPFAGTLGKPKSYITYALVNKETGAVTYIGKAAGYGTAGDVMNQRLGSRIGFGKWKGWFTKHDHAHDGLKAIPIAVQGSSDASKGAEEVFYRFFKDFKGGALTNKIPPRTNNIFDWFRIKRAKGVVQTYFDDLDNGPGKTLPDGLKLLQGF